MGWQGRETDSQLKTYCSSPAGNGAWIHVVVTQLERSSYAENQAVRTEKSG